MISQLQTKLGETVAIFRGLEGNYIGKDKAKIFGATYKTRVQEGEKLLQVIADQYKGVEDYKQQITAEKDRLFPPKPIEETPEQKAQKEAEQKTAAQYR